MEILTFDQLPKAVGELLEKVSKIEDILSHNHPNDADTDADSLFSIKQASIFLNLSISTIYGKVCRREIPVSKQGKKLYFNKTELLDWIKSGRKRTLAEVADSVQLTPSRRAQR
ncbi:helix-turn-helix domain-containing protein [Mucilaginibacter sp. KACC 22773]|uniref:helix-turn-helix domain-containing protein n=1 Tax=Mucilaginibacter sp. KACC 22773 TaxID=3025671 RepID=UPI00236517CF|nr:helix-turn-helix domain-containing protein [Mucilaginibacter sp. KACC 22773]WDF78947.1 helix-turn-helix domain-containing protein [Mucilaginibacter sp. KACC 22773]